MSERKDRGLSDDRSRKESSLEWRLRRLEEELRRKSKKKHRKHKRRYQDLSGSEDDYASRRRRRRGRSRSRSRSDSCNRSRSRSIQNLGHNVNPAEADIGDIENHDPGVNQARPVGEPIAGNKVIQDGSVLEGQNPEPTAEQDKEPELDSEILKVIGNRFLKDKVLAGPVHHDIAIRWEEILKKGLPKEQKEEILEKYPPPKNAVRIEPPQVNPEVKESIQELVIKKDARIVEKQEKIAAGLGAVARALNTLFKLDKNEANLSLIEQVSDVGRLLADLQHDQTEIRKSLILLNVNASFKDTLSSSIPDEWLFGKDLEEKIRAKKALQRSSTDLKTAPKSQGSNHPKNVKTPLQKSKPKTMPPAGSYKPSASYNNVKTQGSHPHHRTPRKPYHHTTRKRT